MPVGIDAKLKRMASFPGVFDLQLDANGDIASEDSFDTAIFVSLGTDARASKDQVLEPTLRRGWIGNERTPGFQIGGLLWLYDGDRITPAVKSGMENAAEQSLEWLVLGGYATAVSATVSFVGREQANLLVLLTKPNGEIEHRNFTLWAQTGLTFGEDV